MSRRCGTQPTGARTWSSRAISRSTRGKVPPSISVLARDRGGIAAYARVTRFHGVAMVMEYGYCDADLDSAIALFRYLGEAAIGTRPSFRLRGDHRRAALLSQGSGPSAPPGVLI